MQSNDDKNEEKTNVFSFRKEELDSIDKFLKDSHRQEVFFVTGVAGIGKTSLLKKVKEQYEQQVTFEKIIYLSAGMFRSDTEFIAKLFDATGLANKNANNDITGRARMYEAIVKGDATLEPDVPESFHILIKELQSLGLETEILEKKMGEASSKKGYLERREVMKGRATSKKGSLERQEVMKGRATSRNVDLISHQFIDRPLLLLVDGLDELPAQIANKVLLILQDIFSSPFCKSKLIVSSRQINIQDERLSSLLHKATYLRLEPLSLVDATTLLRNRFAGKSISQESIDRLLNSIGTNPLLLSILPKLIESDKDIIKILSETTSVHAIVAQYFDRIYTALSNEEQNILFALAKFEHTANINSLFTMTNLGDLQTLYGDLLKLSNKGFIYQDNESIQFAHQLIKEYIKQKPDNTTRSSHIGALHITFDPEMVSKELVLDVLLILNEIYEALDGDELVIKEEEIGRFKYVPEFQLV